MNSYIGSVTQPCLITHLADKRTVHSIFIELEFAMFFFNSHFLQEALT